MAQRRRATQDGNYASERRSRPAATAAKALIAWIDGQVAAAQNARHPLQGRAVMRRLNQVEYGNTVRDLLGVELELKDLLLGDTTPGGFDIRSAPDRPGGTGTGAADPRSACQETCGGSPYRNMRQE
jgi:hypothetical protein